MTDAQAQDPIRGFRQNSGSLAALSKLISYCRRYAQGFLGAADLEEVVDQAICENAEMLSAAGPSDEEVRRSLHRSIDRHRKRAQRDARRFSPLDPSSLPTRLRMANPEGAIAVAEAASQMLKGVFSSTPGPGALSQGDRHLLIEYYQLDAWGLAHVPRERHLPGVTARKKAITRAKSRFLVLLERQRTARIASRSAR